MRALCCSGAASRERRILRGSWRFHRKEPVMEKSASVHWDGAGKTGRGQISTETGALKGYPYGFASRFEDDKRGTNPEEILGAAHAACFTMAFAFACERAGIATEAIDTS